MKLLKLLTLLLAIASTGLFVIASRATPRHITAIAAIQPAMNFAYVQIEGDVLAYPSLSDGYVSFLVQDADSGGQIRVSAYRDVVEQLLTQRHLPMPGDHVTVEGTLRVRDDEASLALNMAEGLAIQTPAAQPIELNAIDAALLGERVMAVGQVRRVRDISPSLRTVTLRMGSGVAEVMLPLSLANQFGPIAELTVGTWIRVSGSVSQYRDLRQILPASAADLQILDASAMPQIELRPIAALGKPLLGQWVAVQGLVTDLSPFKQGMRVQLQDAQGHQILAVVFDSAWQQVPFSQTLAINDTITVQGELANYRGDLEIVPELGLDMGRE